MLRHKIGLVEDEKNILKLIITLSAFDERTKHIVIDYYFIQDALLSRNRAS